MPLCPGKMGLIRKLGPVHTPTPLHVTHHPRFVRPLQRTHLTLFSNFHSEIFSGSFFHVTAVSPGPLERQAGSCF